MASAILLATAILGGCASEPLLPYATATPTTTAPTGPSPSQSEMFSATPTPSAPPTPAAQIVEVLVTTGDLVDGALEVSAMVETASPAAGTCTLVARSAERRVEAEIESTPANEVTYCGIMKIEAGRLTPGAWTYVVEYAATGIAGTSDESGLTVP